MKGTYAIQVTKSTEDEFLIVLHAAGIYLQLIVIVSGGVEALDYLINTGYDRGELTAEFLIMMLQAHVAQDHDAVTDLYRIDNGHIPLYIAFSLQTFLSFKDRRR